MKEQVIIRADDEEVLSELADELAGDEDVDPGDVDYDRSDVPGQAGHPIIIAILILIGKGVAGGAGGFAGQQSAKAIWKKVSGWHSRHGSKATFMIRDADGNERTLSWDEVEKLLKTKGPSTE
jgi:hypothetical protein